MSSERVVLNDVRGALSQHGPLSTRELAERLDMDLGSVHEALHHLARRGEVERDNADQGWWLLREVRG